jgi:hypothetical protein
VCPVVLTHAGRSLTTPAVQTQGHNIRTYTEYLLRRAIEYDATKIDYVRGGEGRLKRLSVDKGLLREAESVQEQIRYLLKCQVRVLCAWQGVRAN